MPHDDARTSVERLIERRQEDPTRRAGRISGRALSSRRTVEAYLKAGVKPRWMERVMEIDGGIAAARRRLERAYRALQAEHAGDPASFAPAWRAVAESSRFDELNELIRQHNEWYPIERDLPMDPRTRDYVLLSGRSYRRPELTPEWVLAEFPLPPSAGG
jgi:hypothetical protein